MKNGFLRVNRNFNLVSNIDAPEYADNHLDVELSVPKGREGVKEVSVRIYTSCYKLMGVGCMSHDVSKTFKKACFDISNDDIWSAGLYRAYVYINGKPQWFCEIKLPVTSNYRITGILHDIEQNPHEMFFAEKLCMKGWWPKLYCGRFKEPLIRILTERLMIFGRDIEEGKALKVPNLLVTGDGESCGAKAFASMILGGYITDDDVSQKYSLSLAEISTGAYGWNHMEEKVAKSKAVIVEVPELDYNAHTINIVNLMASMIRYDTFKETVFVIHGTEKNIDMMMEKCILMQGLFNDRTTFRLSSDRSVGTKYEADEDETEFMKVVEELVDMKYGHSGSSDNEQDLYCKAERDLNRMVGLGRVKDDMQEARMMSMFNKKRAEMCLQTDSECRNHMLFLGNPGTGKTTVARLVGQMYHSMGLLSKGHTVETNRSKLVGEYIGMTEKKTLETIEEARGGVLFIDEAYTLITCDNDNKDFGKEVLNALLTVLSEPEPDMIVIMAGYEDKMEYMLKTNPGLKDRFPLTFHFDDYSADELMEIAVRTLDYGNYTMTEGARNKLKSLIDKAVEGKDKYFGNGRWIHNLINQGIIKSMAKRVMSSHMHDEEIDINLLCSIEECDVEEAERNFLSSKSTKITTSRPIGFRA